MPDYKRYAVAAGTAATILMTGQVMEMTSDRKQARLAQVQAMPLPVEISDIELTAADAELTDIESQETKLELEIAPSLPEPEAADGCEVSLTARPTAAALVQLEIDAPCAPNERVVIHHNGMMFAETTDADGKLDITAAALSETAVFIASFANSEGAVATASVSDLAEFDRAVVQMRGGTGIGLHALEDGAGYGKRGHISADRPGSISVALTGSGGFMLQLGDSSLDQSLVAEIYTLPVSAARDVALNVDIEVTSANCNQDLEAQSLQLSRGGEITVRDLDLTMPGCEMVGDFLMLKNLINDMKVASK